MTSALFAQSTPCHRRILRGNIPPHRMPRDCDRTLVRKKAIRGFGRREGEGKGRGSLLTSCSELRDKSSNSGGMSSEMVLVLFIYIKYSSEGSYQTCWIGDYV